MAIYQKRRRSWRSSRIKPYAVFFLTLITFFYGGYRLLDSDLLKVRSVTVSGWSGAANPQFIEKARHAALVGGTLNIFGLDYLFAWPNKLEILDEPTIKSVTVRKNWLTGNITIVVEERLRHGIWCFNDGCRWFSDDGLTLDPVPVSDGELLVKIHDPESAAPKLRDPVITEKMFQNVMAIIAGIAGHPVTPSSYTVKRGRQELRVPTKEGPELIFSLRFTPSDEMMSFLDAEAEARRLGKLSYIDFTVEQRIYTR